MTNYDTQSLAHSLIHSRPFLPPLLTNSLPPSLTHSLTLSPPPLPPSPLDLSFMCAIGTVLSGLPCDSAGDIVEVKNKLVQTPWISYHGNGYHTMYHDRYHIYTCTGMYSIKLYTCTYNSPSPSLSLDISPHGPYHTSNV